MNYVSFHWILRFSFLTIIQFLGVIRQKNWEKNQLLPLFNFDFNC